MIAVGLFILCVWVLVEFIVAYKMYYRFKIECKLEAQYLMLVSELCGLKKDGYKYLVYGSYLKATYNLNDIGETENVNHLMDMFDGIGFELDQGNAESIDSLLKALDIESNLEDGTLVSYIIRGKIKRGYLKHREAEKCLLYKGGRTKDSSVWYESVDGLGKLKFGNDNSTTTKEKCYERVYMCWPVDSGRDKIKIEYKKGE